MRTLLLWLLLAAPALAQAGAQPPSPNGVTEDSTPLAVVIDGHPYALEAFVARPAEGTTFPVALLLHGAATSDGEVAALNLVPQRQWARSLASRGWLAVSIARRGYSTSQGEPFLKTGSCQEPSLAAYLDRQADDGAAALRAIATRGDADMSRVLLVGKSVGGAVALDLASRPGTKVAAVINIAGGVSTETPRLGLNPACSLYFADLVWNFARFGAVSKMPTLWLYAENDSFFSPELVGRLQTGYRAAGGQVELTMLPAFAPDGHNVFESYAGQYQLWPLVDAFLRQHDLPTWDLGLLDRMEAMVGPSQRWLVRDYLRQAPAQKVFAIADGEPSGAAWGSYPESMDRAKTYALQECSNVAKRPCHLAALNFELVPPAPAAASPASPVADTPKAP